MIWFNLINTFLHWFCHMFYDKTIQKQQLMGHLKKLHMLRLNALKVSFWHLPALILSHFWWEDDVEAASKGSLVETSDIESAHSEQNFLTPSCIDSIILGIFEDDVKTEATTDFFWNCRWWRNYWIISWRW